MKRIRDLEAVEIRVLGALLEKEQTTPDQYPLTVNSLIGACNQKSNRDPVTRLTETEVIEALEGMRRDVLVWRSEGARVERWSQSVSRRLELDRAGKAVLTLLMLRGPQTAGELRSRAGRLHPFGTLEEVHATLRGLAAEDVSLTTELPRRPGQKETRWTHRLGAGEPAVCGPQPTATGGAGIDERLAALEERVERLEALLEPPS